MQYRLLFHLFALINSEYQSNIIFDSEKQMETEKSC